MARAPARRGRAGDQAALRGLRSGRRGPGARARRARRATRRLRRLGVDVIDLYQVHAPDPDVALEDTLAALDGLVRAGKVRALGASNFPAWLLAWAVGAAGSRGPLALRLAAAAVLARRALDRDRDPALLPRRRARRAAVGPARGRLPDRPLRARRRAAAGHAHRRRERRPRGGARPPRDRGQLPRRRRGARGGRRAGRERRAGRARVAAAPSRASPRRSSGRAPSSSSRTCCPPPSSTPDRRAGRAARALDGARARLSRAHEHRAERRSTSAGSGCGAERSRAPRPTRLLRAAADCRPADLQGILQEAGILPGSVDACRAESPARRVGDRGNRCGREEASAGANRRTAAA